MSLDLSKKQFIKVIFPSNIKIFPLHNLGRGEIYTLYSKVFKKSSDRFISSLDSKEKEHFIKHFFDNSRLHRVSSALFKDNQFIGFFAVHPSSKVIEIVAFGIHPNYRNKGLGTAFLAYQLKRLAAAEFQICYTEVDPRNIEPYRLYQKFGFTTISKKSVFYGGMND